MSAGRRLSTTCGTSTGSSASPRGGSCAGSSYSRAPGEPPFRVPCRADGGVVTVEESDVGEPASGPAWPRPGWWGTPDDARPFSVGPLDQPLPPFGSARSSPLANAIAVPAGPRPAPGRASKRRWGLVVSVVALVMIAAAAGGLRSPRADPRLRGRARAQPTSSSRRPRTRWRSGRPTWTSRDRWSTSVVRRFPSRATVRSTSRPTSSLPRSTFRPPRGR